MRGAYRRSKVKSPTRAFLIGLFVVIDSLPAYAQAPDTQRVVTNAQGKKEVLIRWAVESPDNIITLHQPLGYISLWAGVIGTWLGPDYGNQILRNRQSATTMSFSALLPEMQARTAANEKEFLRPGGGDQISGLVESGVYEASPFSLRERFNIRLRIKQDGLIAVIPIQPHPMQLAKRPDRFGLRRIGPQPALTQFGSAYVRISDLYFDQETPETSSLYIACDAEEVRSKEDDPREKLVPQCEHVFVYEPLTAIVSLHYRRVHLMHWRDIQAKTEQLLQSFMEQQ